MILDKLLRVNYDITQLHVIPQIYPIRCKSSRSAKPSFMESPFQLKFVHEHQKLKNMAEEFQALWFAQTSWCP